VLPRLVVNTWARSPEDASNTRLTPESTGFSFTRVTCSYLRENWLCCEDCSSGAKDESTIYIYREVSRSFLTENKVKVCLVLSKLDLNQSFTLLQLFELN
jgi:hypothetical protein